MAGLAVPAIEAAAAKLGPLLARIAGFAFDTAECRWSDEWKWEGVDFDGVQREACLLQETKGDEDGDPKFFFTGFTDTRRQILRQSVVVNSNPPAQLMWCFMTPRTRGYPGREQIAACPRTTGQTANFALVHRSHW